MMVCDSTVVDIAALAPVVAVVTAAADASGLLAVVMLL